MKRLLVAALFAISLSGSSITTANFAAAEEARPLSAAQLQKILKFVDTIGAKEEFPPPTAQNLGVSGDPNLALRRSNERPRLLLSQRAQPYRLHHLGAHRRNRPTCF